MMELYQSLGFIDEAAETAFMESYQQLLKHLPEPYWGEPNGMTVPLYDALDNVGEAITDFCLPLLYDCPNSLEPLRKQLFENEAHMNGLSIRERRKKAVPAPQERKEPPEELIKLYFAGTPILPLFYAQVPFTIPRKTFASHGIILAPPNHGKTQLLGSLIASFLASDNPPGLFVLDPHGDLFTTLRSRVPASRLVCLDPDTQPPALNFLDFGSSTEAQTLQTFSYLMSSLSGGLSDKQGAIVPYLLKLLRKIPNASLETLRQIVDEKVKGVEKSQFASIIATLPAVDQGFFHNQFYNSRMQETKDAIGWKLYSALSSDAFRQMFSAKTNSFDADAAMRDRKVVLVKGARGALGDVGMQVFLQFIVAQFMAAALRREQLPPAARQLCLLFADEAHHIFNSQTANILTECRKYGLGFIAATQVVQQIPDDVKAAIYGATAIKIAGPVSHNDAQILSREMYTSSDFIRSMESVEGSHANWAISVAPSKKALKVRVPYGALERLPKLNIRSFGHSPRIPQLQPTRASRPVIPVHRTPEEQNQDWFDACYDEAMKERAEIHSDPHTPSKGRG